MESIRINPKEDSEIEIDIKCNCGKGIHLSSADKSNMSFCGSCEKAYYLETHSNHYHVNIEDMSRSEVLQYSYGKLSLTK